MDAATVWQRGQSTGRSGDTTRTRRSGRHTSTNKPTEILGAIGELDGNPWYADVSGTPMSCPLTAGVVSLVLEAYKREAGRFPKPIDAINIVEATAEGGTTWELESHTEANMGAGFVDAKAAVDLAMELGAEAAEDGGRGPPEDMPGKGEGPPDDDDHPGRGPPDREEDPTAPRHPELWDEVERCSFGEHAEEDDDDDDDAGDPECVEVVDDEQFSGEVLVGAGSLVGLDEETTDEFGTEAFATSDLPGALMDVTVRVDGPPGFEWTEIDVEHERGGEWKIIGSERFEAPEGELRLIDGRSHGVEETAEIDDGETYRIVIRAATSLDSAVQYDIEVEFGAYSPDPCE